ncbi:hypothetical protein GBA52_003462 [Prunus armeniaca]|nr:hypothetical protein GBA52_003462 [Prunus armeniaca]
MAIRSRAFTFSARRPQIVVKDGASKRFRSKDFAPPKVMEKDGFSVEYGDYEVENSPYGHSIRFSELVKNKIYRPWWNYAIIKFVGILRLSKRCIVIEWRSYVDGA